MLHQVIEPRRARPAFCPRDDDFMGGTRPRRGIMFRLCACVALVWLSSTVNSFGQSTSAEVDQEKAAMESLSQQTEAGSYFPTSQVPVELNSFRLHMLAIGNLGRRDPDYRKKHGEKQAQAKLYGNGSQGIPDRNL